MTNSTTKRKDNRTHRRAIHLLDAQSAADTIRSHMPEDVRRELVNELSNDIQPVVTAINSTLDQYEQELSLATSQDDLIFQRGRNGAFKDMLRHNLPRLIRDRKERFGIMWKAALLYIETSAALGAAWASADNRRTQADNQHASENFQKLTYREFGFSNPREATTCTRVAQIHAENRRIYYEECLTNNREPTLYGAERVWHEYRERDTTGETPPGKPQQIIYTYTAQVVEIWGGAVWLQITGGDIEALLEVGDLPVTVVVELGDNVAGN